MMSRSTPSSTEQASDPLQLAPRKEEVSEEDDDLFMVPEMEDAAQRKGNDVGGAQEKRGRSRNTADREHKKIKRYIFVVFVLLREGCVGFDAMTGGCAGC
uniref:Uncharacterized protein n=1 Tax=Kalanchoe fedtschenkoi TaxID=63787 RepID=A0A7N0UBJ2_KALFE